MQVQIVGMPWFAEDDYESFRSVLPDRAWHATYGAWLQAAEQNLKRLEQQGVRAIKADVRSDAFAEWCRSTGRNVDTEALTGWANEAAFRAHTQDQGSR